MQSTSNLIQVLPRIASRVYQPQDWFAAQALFPLFRAPHATGGYYIIGDSDFISNPPSLIRSPGAPFARHQMILKDDTYACELFGLEESIGQEENAKYASPGAPTQIAKRRLLSTMLLVGELRAQTVATGASVPSANPGVLWSNPASDPLSDVSVARQSIFTACAEDANLMVCPRSVYESLKAHPAIKAMIKLSDGDARWPQLLAALFDVDRFFVARAVYNSANEGQPVITTEVWGDDVFIAKVDDAPLEEQDLQTPSFGRTFSVIEGDPKDSPFGILVNDYREEPVASGIARADQWVAEKLTAPICGYRLKSVLG